MGFLAKKSPYINNNIIIIQNIIVGLIAAILYYIITNDFSTAISMSGIFAETGYNLVNNLNKLINGVSITGANNDIKKTTMEETTEKNNQSGT